MDRSETRFPNPAKRWWWAAWRNKWEEKVKFINLEESVQKTGMKKKRDWMNVYEWKDRRNEGIKVPKSEYYIQKKYFMIVKDRIWKSS